MKSLSTAPIEERKKYLKKPNYLACIRCDSTDLIFKKVVGYGSKAGLVYHYKVKCAACNRKYFVERNEYVYNKVKDLPWYKSKSYLKKFPDK